MSTESEGRGLPVGWAWGDDAGPKGPGVESRYLYAPGATDYNAAAYNDGSWDAYAGECRTETVGGSMVPHDSPRSPDLLAAAQREAVAALWRAGVFGDVAEVDAVRAPVEPASLPCPDDFEPQHFGVDGSGQERMPPPLREPAPREPSAPNLHDQIRARSFIAPTKCTCGANVSRWIDKGNGRAACNGCGAVITYGPSAPADELARLLPGLEEDIERVRSMLGREVSMARRMRLARACELLLAERERMAREIDSLARFVDAGETICSGMQARAETAEREAVALRARSAELTATPPPGTVAALLAKVAQRAKEADRDATQFSGREQEIDASYEEGRSVGLDNAAGMIRDALVPLGAPSPLDAVVAEVCALDVAEAIPSTVETIGDHAMVVREILHDVSGTVERKRSLFARAGRACLAGMLACDAKGGST